MTGELSRYCDMTWEDVERAAKDDRVVLVPVGTVEQHGPHLPVDTDNRIAEAFCTAAEQHCRENTCLVAPTVGFGLSQHLADFPGAVFHTSHVFVDVLTEVFASYASSGFRRVLALNAHGSNVAPLDLATKEALHRHPGHQFASVSWWELSDVRDVVARSGPPSQASHACAFETSIMLTSAPEMVRLDKVVPGQPYPDSAHVWRDLFGRRPEPTHRNPVRLTEMWSSWSDNGVRGDPRDATAELGEAMLEAGGKELAAIIDELRGRPLRDARRNDPPRHKEGEP
ncbi:MAG: creatininase family protein [Actinobacteria bacterium]|nr:creatininase family protein [Actinomycetota bacterium]